MKKRLLPVLALACMAACKNSGDSKTQDKDTLPATKTTVDPKAVLLGKWDVTEVASEDPADLPEEARKMLIDEATLEFTSDSKAIQHFHGESDTANFTYDAANSKLYTFDDDKNDTATLMLNADGTEMTVTNKGKSLKAKKM